MSNEAPAKIGDTSVDKVPDPLLNNRMTPLSALGQPLFAQISDIGELTGSPEVIKRNVSFLPQNKIRLRLQADFVLFWRKLLQQIFLSAIH